MAHIAHYNKANSRTPGWIFWLRLAAKHQHTSSPKHSYPNKKKMALRNYLYAKHSDSSQSALINKSPSLQPQMTRFPRRSSSNPPQVYKQELCPPERQLVLEDGSRKCANCADCPRKAHESEVSPKIKVEVDKLPEAVGAMALEVDYTNYDGHFDRHPAPAETRGVAT